MDDTKHLQDALKDGLVATDTSKALIMAEPSRSSGEVSEAPLLAPAGDDAASQLADALRLLQPRSQVRF
jgi:hypothetical protein